jgi:Tfp pilus assembly protein PilE
MKKLLTQLKENRDSGQSGINMVDLMMWLVIAALLLAAAIQGIGYYQKNAYLYQMKSDAVHAAETVTAKVANTDGKFTADNVAAGLDDTKKTADVTITAESGASDAAGYVLRSTHPNVDDKDVVFLSKQRGSYAPGVHVVPKGTVIEDDGSTVVTPPDGGGEDTGGGNEDNIPYTPVVSNGNYSPAIFNYIESEMAFNANKKHTLAIEGFYSAAPTPEQEEAMEWYDFGPEAAAIDAAGGWNFSNVLTKPSTTEQVSTYIDYVNLTSRTDVSGLPALKSTVSNTENNLWNDPTTENQSALLDAQSDFYTTAVAAPMPDTSLVAYPGDPASFNNKVIPAGPRDLGGGNWNWANFKFTIPSSLPYTWSGGGTAMTEPGRYEIGNVKTNNNEVVTSYGNYTKDANGVAYWSFNVLPQTDWVSGKTYTFAATVKDTTTNILYYKAFSVTVQ